MTTTERVNVWLNVGDRLVLWIGLLALIALFAFHDKWSEENSPTLIAPVCVDVPNTVGKASLSKKREVTTAPVVGQEKSK